jgi:hypothetical protein
MLKHLTEEERFYKKPFLLSYSGLNKLLFSPKLFYRHYVLNQKEESLDTHLVEGKLLHTLVLEPDNFDKIFIISPGKIPKDNAKIIVDAMYNKTLNPEHSSKSLENFEYEILELMVNLNYYQNLKTDEQRIAKVLTEDNINYFNFLTQLSSKILIEQKSYEKCMELRDELISDEIICYALYCNNPAGVDIYSEKYLESTFLNYSFKLKGYLDRLVIDHNQKCIKIVDLKTTSKAIDRFKESIDYYRYDLQAAIYYTLCEAEFTEKYPDYSLQYSFIVVDPFVQKCVFEISIDTMKDWLSALKEKVEVFNWHYVNKNFELPFDLASGYIIL